MDAAERIDERRSGVYTIELGGGDEDVDASGALTASVLRHRR